MRSEKKIIAEVSHLLSIYMKGKQQKLASFFSLNECERQFTVLFLATKFQGSNTIDASLVNINPGDKWIHITFHSYA